MLLKLNAIDEWSCERSGSFLYEYLYDHLGSRCLHRTEFVDTCVNGWNYRGTIREQDNGRNKLTCKYIDSKFEEVCASDSQISEE